MQVNLSIETIKTVWKSLTFEKTRIESILECGSFSKENEDRFKIMLAEYESALRVFDELI